jgi:hypothetical protein
MKPEVKAKWIAALRSGEYKQGRGVLRDGDTFCCLGVLCDLHAKATGGQWKITFHSSGQSRQEYFGHMTLLPETVQTWSGVNDSLGGYADTSLAGQNDKGAAFRKIAALIKEHF